MSVALALLIAACGDDGSPSIEDASPDAPVAALAIDDPIAPAAAELPRIAPCPQGWREATLGPTTICEPWPDGAACADEEMRLPGRGCVDIGEPCSDDFATGLPASGVRYVRPGASGTGSRTRPFGTIAEAIAGATSNDVIALARGEYREAIAIDRSLQIRGACTDETRIVGPAGEPALSSVGQTWSLSDATVTSTGAAAIDAMAGRVELTRVRIAGAQDTGIAIHRGANGTLDHVDVRGVVRGPMLRPAGVIVVEANVEIRDSAIGGFGSPALAIQAGTVHVERSSFHDIGDAWLIGVDEATATLDETVVTGATTTRLFTGTTVVARRSILPELAAVDGRYTLERTLIRDAAGVDLGVDNGDAHLTDVVLGPPGTRRIEGVDVSTGLAGSGDSTIVADRIAILGAALSGLSLIGTTYLRARDMTIVSGEGELGGALTIPEGAGIEAERVRVVQSFGAAVIVGPPHDSTRGVVIRDLVVEHAGERPTTNGITIDGRNVELERVAIQGPFFTSLVVVGPESNVVARDLRIAEADGAPRRAIEVRAAGAIDVERAVIERSREQGIVLIEEGTTLDARHVRVLESRVRCDAPPCEESEFGIGIGAYFRSRASLASFELAGSARCGVHLLYGGSVMLRDGVVRDHPIAVCAEQNAVDIDTLSEGVSYENNERVLDGVTLPVPEATD